MAIFPGFTGALNIDGKSIKFESASIAAKQDVNLPDLVAGTYKKGSYNYSKIEVGGSASGPVDEDFGTSLWDKAFNRTSDCFKLEPCPFSVTYYCDGLGLSVTSGAINTMKLSCTAGELAQWSIDVVGGGYSSGSASVAPSGQKKLVTWDAFTVTTPFGNTVQAFEVEINNNAQMVWAMNGGYAPLDIIAGLRMITGSVTVYDPNGTDGGSDSYATSTADKNFSVTGGGLNIDFTGSVAYARIEPKLGVGPFMATYKFTVVEG